VIAPDTNVVSELMRAAPAVRVSEWLDGQPRSALHTTAVTVGELEYGVARLPEGCRRSALGQGLSALLEEDLAGRVLPFDLGAARVYGPIVAARRLMGRPVGVPDGQIAAVSIHRGATLASRNTQDFEGLGLTLIDPWSA
jgi:predicted nucleic acid-binding protein